MKRKTSLIVSILAVFVTVVLACSLVACDGGVVPCAWVTLDAEGYVVYTSYVYATSHGHIQLWESEEDANAQFGTEFIMITFYPRAMGSETVNDVRTILVDIGDNYLMMSVSINKTKASYDPNKRLYLNGELLTPTRVNDLDTLLFWEFESPKLVRGNPGGRANGYVNHLEYK